MRPNLYLQRAEDYKKQLQCIERELGLILLRKDRKWCALSSLEGRWAKAQKGEIWHSKNAESALEHQTFFHVRVHFGLSFQGFLIQFLHLDMFSSLVYDFFISFLDNSGFFRNNYLVDKYNKINLDKINIIHNFIVIQSSLLFLCMHPYFKH